MSHVSNVDGFSNNNLKQEGREPVSEVANGEQKDFLARIKPNKIRATPSQRGNITSIESLLYFLCDRR